MTPMKIKIFAGDVVRDKAALEQEVSDFIAEAKGNVAVEWFQTAAMGLNVRGEPSTQHILTAVVEWWDDEDEG